MLTQCNRHQFVDVVDLDMANRTSQPNRRPSDRLLGRLGARLHRVPLDRIELSPESEGLLNELGPLPSLVVPDEVAELVSTMCPPVLVADPDRQGHYFTVGDGRIIQWLKDPLLVAHGRSSRVVSVILHVPTLGREKLSAIRTHLAPLVLGLLSDEATRRAKRALADAGLSRLRGVSRRRQLAHLMDC